MISSHLFRLLNTPAEAWTRLVGILTGTAVEFETRHDGRAPHGMQIYRDEDFTISLEGQMHLRLSIGHLSSTFDRQTVAKIIADLQNAVAMMRDP